MVVPVLMNKSEAKVLIEKEKYSVRVLQMDNLRGLLDIRRIVRIPDARASVV